MRIFAIFLLLSNVSLLDCFSQCLLTSNAIAGDHSNPESFIEFNDEIYFWADDGIHGKELWKTDGTLEGTILLKDIFPGKFDSFVRSRMVHTDSLMFFLAETRIEGIELWKTDGTEHGTTLVKDINLKGSSMPREMIIYKNKLFFIATDSTFFKRLWRSNGTNDGTIIVNEFGPEGNSLSPKKLFEFKESLIIAGSDNLGESIWKTDGTKEGTLMIKNILKDSITSDLEIYVAQDYISFFYTFINEIILVRSDGSTEGTFEIKRFYLDISKSPSSSPVNVGNITFFLLYDSIHGREIWRTDGTIEGTYLLKDINPGNQTSFPYYFTVGKNNIFFTASDNLLGNELWISNGTSQGTKIVKDIYPGREGSNPYNLIFDSNTLFFTANDSIHGYELWKSDGTPEGTSLLFDFNPGPSSSAVGGWRLWYTVYSEILYFPVLDGISGIWRSDGTTEGTYLVNNLDTKSHNPLVFGNRIIFTGNDGNYGYELWQTDGTSHGTQLIKDINRKLKIQTQNFQCIENIFFYTNTDSVVGNEIFFSDGSYAKTTKIQDPTNALSKPRESRVVTLNNNIFFIGHTEDFGAELWKSDGSVEGTLLVHDIYTASKSSNPVWLTASSGKIYFSAYTPEFGQELWISNGLSEGTFLIKDIYSEDKSSAPSWLVSHESSILFQADDGVLGRELWISDGTEAGTSLLMDVNPGPNSSNPRNIIGVDDKVVFTASDSLGIKLWVLENLSNPSIKTIDIPFTDVPLTLDHSRTRENFINHKSKLYFIAFASPFYGLWSFDGNEGGTTLIHNLWGSNLYDVEFNIIHDMVIFSANDEESGVEIWISDGTTEGAQILKDIEPGKNSSFPRDFIELDSNFCFVANGNVGNDIWISDGTTEGTKLYFESNHDITVESIYSCNNTIFAIGDYYQYRDAIFEINSPCCIGAPCDDFNANTIDDSINQDCKCLGLNVLKTSDDLGIFRDLGIKKKAPLSQDEIKFWPNPSYSTLHIESNITMEQATLRITDNLGRVYIQQVLDSPHSQLDLTSLQEGVYFICVLSNKEFIYTKPIVKLNP